MEINHLPLIILFYHYCFKELWESLPVIIISFFYYLYLIYCEARSRIASENISARNKKWIITNTRQLKPAETDFCNTFGVFLTPPHSEEVQYFLYITFWIFSDIICAFSCGIQHSSPLPIIGLATVSCFYFIKSLRIQLFLKYQEVSFDKVI